MYREDLLKTAKGMKRLLACFMVFCTVCTMILPAFALESEPICGVAAHTHGEACYAERVEYALHCGDFAAEAVVHQHSALCYNDHGALICTLEEKEAHTHSDECYVSEPVLICAEAESDVHTHGEGCYTQGEPVLVCEKEELILHSHTKECWHGMDTPGVIPVLVCQEPVVVEHTHENDCLTVVSTASELVCQLAEHVHEEGCYPSEQETPAEPEQEIPAEPEQGTEEETHKPELPEMTAQTAETENYIVTVTYRTDLELPEGTELRVMEYAKDSEIFRKRCEEAGYELEWLLNIGLYEGDTELDLSGQFNVVVTPKEGGEAATDITHFEVEGAQRIQGINEGDAAVSFATDSFSDFGGGKASRAADYIYGYPQSVRTGEVDINRLRFYNLCEDHDGGVKALAGCVFEIVGDNGYKATVTSGDSIEVHLPAGIPDGGYTITEISAPDGHMRDDRFQRHFTIRNGALVSDDNIGTFINHHLGKVESSKTAEVEDYNNRIYQILLQAESHMRKYEMDPVDVLFVVDQSNSMLFPAGLKDTGKVINVHKRGWYNVNRLYDLGLDTSQVYYIISDPAATSTVYAVWHNGSTWLYQDASYYAKARQNNETGYKDPNETAIFPGDRSFNDQKTAEKNTGNKSNGGGMMHSMEGSNLWNYISNVPGGNGEDWNFRLYTATDQYNRLHYLEEALANMIYELADVNSENRVTLVRFTKEVKASDCMGPLELTPANTETLVDAVTHINTGGGTRQDIALEYTYDNYLNANKGYGDAQHTYTILVTDGAPVLSGGSTITNLGDYNSPANGNTVYGNAKLQAQDVRDKSTLMTVSLGMGGAEGGRLLLKDIATTEEFFCALDDAAELVHKIQELMFNAFRPKDEIIVNGDIVDEISDSFYPIAWTDSNNAAATGRRLLEQSNGKDWIELQPGDRITLDGKFTTQTDEGITGLVQRKDDGTFYIRWDNAKVSDPRSAENQAIAWVRKGQGASTGRTVVASDDHYDWVKLDAGDWITPQGQYYTGWVNQWNKDNYGQITYTNNKWNVSWGSNTNNGRDRLYYDHPGWEGTFYVKAKEDFIGGNAIDTNKSASVTVHGAVKEFEIPTVNVRLLDMNEHSSETTVYLGDLVNGKEHHPVSSLMEFWDSTTVTKLIADDGDANVLNKFNPVYSDGLEAAEFYLRYALGRDLTDAEWVTLARGDTLHLDYTYDRASSHGPVGHFVIKLEKQGIEGARPEYGAHEATAACQPDGTPDSADCRHPAETYTLHIKYEAYGLGYYGRPTANVNNGSGSPGTEVGKGSTLPTGKGTVEKASVHEVHVISGAIEVTKVIADGMEPTEDQTFSFVLHRVEDDDDTSRDVTKTLTVPAGSKGPVTVRFENLRRGTYTVTEAQNEAYMVESIEVMNTTNTQSTPAIGERAKNVTFTMGNNIGGDNVINQAAEDDRYTAYTDSPNGVFGAARFTNVHRKYEAELPVKKVWGDGSTNHGGTVYVVLYQNGSPVLTEDGSHRILRLNSANGWTDKFIVLVDHKDDKVSDYNFSVREVSDISDSPKVGWQAAVLENGGGVVYYKSALQEGEQLKLKEASYMVFYSVAADGTLIVTNKYSADLPGTGGSGTHLYQFSGLLLTAAALIYGCALRRRNRKEGKS